MTHFVKFSSVLVCSVVLAGCGGSSGKAMIEDMAQEELGEEEMEQEQETQPATFAEIASAADATANRIGLLSDTETDDFEPALPSDILTPGSATYDGQVAVLIGDSIDDPSRENLADADVLGLVRLDVDFTNSGGSLSGEFYNFVDSDGEVFDGQLDIADTPLEVDPDAVGIVAGISGTLTDQSNIDTDIEADLIGLFLEQETFFGIAGGTVTSQGFTDDFLGVVVAEE